MTAFEIFRNQGIVGDFEAILHGEVQAGRGFAATGYADQDHVGIFQIPVGLAVVVFQREVDGLDPLFVFQAFHVLVRQPDFLFR